MRHMLNSTIEHIRKIIRKSIRFFFPLVPIWLTLNYFMEQLFY